MTTELSKFISELSKFIDSYKVPEPEPTPEPEPEPTPEPAPNPSGFAAIGNTLEEAKAAFAAGTELDRADCDKQNDVWVCASYSNPKVTDVTEPFGEPEPRDTPLVPEPNSPDLLFSESFEDGKIDPRLTWTGSNDGTPDRRRIITQDNGNKCLAHVEIRGDKLEAKAHRTESDGIKLKEGRFKDGDTVWTAFSVMFPEPYEMKTAETIVCQQKAYSSPPMWLFGQTRGKFVFRGGNDKSSNYGGTIAEKVETDVWYHCVLGQTLSLKDEKARGHIEVWTRTENDKEYKRLLSHDGPNMRHPPAGNETYLKWGNYFPHMDVNSRTILIDNIRIGKTRQSVSI